MLLMLRVTPSNAKSAWERKDDRKSKVEQMALISRSVFLAKLAQFTFMFCYVFMRFLCYIICFYYVY